MLDAWTETFATPGARTSGTKAARFVVVGPSWHGALPSDLAVIRAPTNLVWLIGRIQTNGAADYPNVHALQDGLLLTPLSAPEGMGTPPSPSRAAAKVGGSLPPPAQVAGMDASAFFSAFAAALRDNPPHPEDAAFVASLGAVGIVPGKSFDMAALDRNTARQLDRAVSDARGRLARADVTVRNGWSFSNTIGVYGTAYPERAATARTGLGALPADEALYPATSVDGDGEPLSGARRYMLRFPKGGAPPARAFWSLALYDSDGYFVPNALDRYAVGDRDALFYEKDGSLRILIQHERPAGDQAANWLPAPADGFNLVLRVYWPEAAALKGGWAPPAVERVR